MQPTYVQLTQIPYTGVDFGAFGDSAYWLGFTLFALAGAYLILYYKGGFVSFFRQIFG